MHNGLAHSCKKHVNAAKARVSFSGDRECLRSYENFRCVVCPPLCASPAQTAELPGRTQDLAEELQSQRPELEVVWS